jgi:hypothetical protein
VIDETDLHPDKQYFSRDFTHPVRVIDGNDLHPQKQLLSRDFNETEL